MMTEPQEKLPRPQSRLSRFSKRKRKRHVESKESLEKNKLRLEIQKLEVPWWRQPQSMGVMAGFLVALGGWITTAVYSNIGSKLEIIGLNEKIKVLSDEKEVLVSRLVKEKKKFDADMTHMTQVVKAYRKEEASLLDSLKLKRSKIVLAEANLIPGIVLDRNGSPLSDAQIEVQFESDNERVIISSTTSAENGTFHVPFGDDVRDGGYSLVVRRLDYVSDPLRIESVPTEPLVVEMYEMRRAFPVNPIRQEEKHRLNLPPPTSIELDE